MRDPFDVRDLHGRLTRFLAAIPLGILTSLAVTFVLPTREHYAGWRGCWSIEGGWFVTGGSVTLILVGAIVSTLAWTAALGHLRSKRRLPLLPRARLVRRYRARTTRAAYVPKMWSQSAVDMP
jgi:hypothetical protein